MGGSFLDRYGPWAFVAGASAGLGAAFADEAARRGTNVILCARRSDVMERTAAELRDRHCVEVRTVTVDMGSPDLDDVVAAATDDVEVGLFIYNAAAEPQGRFLATPTDELLTNITVNCVAPTVLTKRFAAAMVSEDGVASCSCPRWARSRASRSSPRTARPRRTSSSWVRGSGTSSATRAWMRPRTCRRHRDAELRSQRQHDDATRPGSVGTRARGVRKCVRRRAPHTRRRRRGIVRAARYRAPVVLTSGRRRERLPRRDTPRAKKPSHAWAGSRSCSGNR